MEIDDKTFKKRKENAIKYALKHIEDFGDAHYTRTGETQCIGHLAYNCINLAAAMNMLKIMEGKTMKSLILSK